MSAVWFMAGLWFGATVGVLLMGLLASASQTDDCREVEPV